MIVGAGVGSLGICLLLVRCGGEVTYQEEGVGHPGVYEQCPADPVARALAAGEDLGQE